MTQITQCGRKSAEIFKRIVRAGSPGPGIFSDLARPAAKKRGLGILRVRPYPSHHYIFHETTDKNLDSRTDHANTDLKRLKRGQM